MCVSVLVGSTLHEWKILPDEPFGPEALCVDKISAMSSNAGFGVSLSQTAAANIGGLPMVGDAPPVVGGAPGSPDAVAHAPPPTYEGLAGDATPITEPMPDAAAPASAADFEDPVGGGTPFDDHMLSLFQALDEAPAPRPPLAHPVGEAGAGLQHGENPIEDSPVAHAVVTVPDKFADDLVRARLSLPGATTSTGDFAAMWVHAHEAFKDLERIAPVVPLGNGHSVLSDTDRLHQCVLASYPDWPKELVRLAAGALHCYKKRLTDLSERDHVHLLWVLCGEDLLRSHGGVVYVYDPVYGQWAMYEGLVSQHVLESVKQAGLVLEGLFRCLPPGVHRDDDALLRAVDRLSANVSFKEFCHECTMASVWNKGDRFGGGQVVGRGFPNADGGDDGIVGPGPEDGLPVVMAPQHVEAGQVPWPLQVARAVGRVLSQLVRNLESGRPLSKFAEWCSQDMKRAKGVAYKDCVLLYDVDGAPLCFTASRRASLNVYVKIQHDLLSVLDPVLEGAITRLQRAYQETFWANAKGFRFGQACLALAIRGCNINQITVYWGPGGVGMSSFTSHLVAMYGEHNHAMFDPNVFYDDAELRKQIERLMGRFIYTGQERPVGTRHGVRQDLVKKFATGEGIAGRMPYGVLTKLYKVIGWKRLELNSMINFENVVESNFESIMRRFAVISLKSRFVEPHTLRDVQIQPEGVGVFQRDPDLESFYTSGPAVAAGLKIQHAFERTHSMEDCRQVLIEYTRLGGDNGVGMAYLREACGLPAMSDLPQEQASALGSVAHLLAPDAKQTAEVDRVAQVSETLMRHLVTKGVDFLTRTLCMQCGGVHAVAGLTREALWNRLKESPLWRDIGTRRKSHENLIPVIFTEHARGLLYAGPNGATRPPAELDQLCDRDSSATDFVAPECYDLCRLRDYLTGSPARGANLQILTEALTCACADMAPRRRGTVADPPQWVALRKRVDSLRAMDEMSHRLLENMSEPDAVPASPVGTRTPKRRRLVRKSTASFVVTQNITYQPKVSWRSRLYSVTQPCAQAMDQRMQKILLSDTIDFDIANCMPVLLDQMIRRLGLRNPELWKSETDLLHAIAFQRQAYCEEHLRMPVSQGKRVLHEMLQGGPAPAVLRGNTEVAKLVALARFLRWWACSVGDKVYGSLRQHDGDDAKKWPESSTLAYVWQGVEDHVLQSMVEYTLTKDTTHLSLHFDGLRIDRTRVRMEGGVGDSESLMCNNLSEHVKLRTGYEVCIVAKQHHYVLESLRLQPVTRQVPDIPEVLLAAGNCIPLAVACVTANFGVATRYVQSSQGPPSQGAVRGRVYRDVASDCGVHLVPCWELPEPGAGQWLVHVENGGRAHCFGVRAQAVDEFEVYFDGNVVSMSWLQLQGLLNGAVDRKTAVFFQVYTAPAAVIAKEYMASLLDLTAGGV